MKSLLNHAQYNVGERFNNPTQSTRVGGSLHFPAGGVFAAGIFAGRTEWNYAIGSFEGDALEITTGFSSQAGGFPH